MSNHTDSYVLASTASGPSSASTLMLAGKPVDRGGPAVNFLPVKLRHLRAKLARLDLTKADREVAALKDRFRREDLALASEGKHEEIALRNRRLMGLKDGARTRLVGYGGVRFE